MTYVVWYQVPGDTVPSPEYCDTKEEAEDFANRAIEAGWYVVKNVEEVGELTGVRITKERFFDISASDPYEAHEVAKKAFQRLFGSVPQEFYVHQIGV